MIIVDIETSGTNASCHSILSIGAIDFDDKNREHFSVQCRAFEGAKLEDEAFKINGITKEEALDPKKMSEAEALKKFIDWASESKDHTVGGQNPQFDVSFLLEAGDRANLDISIPRRVIDLHSICYAHMISKGLKPPVSHNRTDINSDFIMNYVGVPAEPKPHIAFNGAKYEAEAFSRLLYNRPFFDEFKDYKIPWL